MEMAEDELLERLENVSNVENAIVLLNMHHNATPTRVFRNGGKEH